MSKQRVQVQLCVVVVCPDLATLKQSSVLDPRGPRFVPCYRYSSIASRVILLGGLLFNTACMIIVSNLQISGTTEGRIVLV